MLVQFYKYHGNGNDFILIDDRNNFHENLSAETIARLCRRRFGIGADGLILLKDHKQYDFQMVYFNSDGNESTMCGNGGRCIIRFAEKLHIIQSKTTFLAIDGEHEGIINKNGNVMLKMKDVGDFEKADANYIVHTGSPHFVKFVDDVKTVDVFHEGKKIRTSAPFAKEGINVNFVQQLDDHIRVRTYERGVEDETLSCGTGVVAAALMSAAKKNDAQKQQSVQIATPGGKFEVTFTRNGENKFHDIWLIGGAEFIFTGEVEI